MRRAIAINRFSSLPSAERPKDVFQNERQSNGLPSSVRLGKKGVREPVRAAGALGRGATGGGAGGTLGSASLNSSFEVQNGKCRNDAGQGYHAIACRDSCSALSSAILVSNLRTHRAASTISLSASARSSRAAHNKLLRSRSRYCSGMGPKVRP